MKTLAKTILCILPILCMEGCSTADSIITSTVPSLDIERYMGRWYEVARMDHSFERGLTGCMANYSLQDDGTVRVVNSGFKNNLEGDYKESVGKARRPDSRYPGKLEVSFFLWFYSDYNVMELADDYRYALVGSKSEDYLWILSRTPQLLPEDKDYLINQAKARGYDVTKLIWVQQR